MNREVALLALALSLVACQPIIIIPECLSKSDYGQAWIYKTENPGFANSPPENNNTYYGYMKMSWDLNQNCFHDLVVSNADWNPSRESIYCYGIQNTADSEGNCENRFLAFDYRSILNDYKNKFSIYDGYTESTDA